MDRNVKEEGVTESRVLFQQGKERSEAQRACCPVEMSFQKNPLDLGMGSGSCWFRPGGVGAEAVSSGLSRC